MKKIVLVVLLLAFTVTPAQASDFGASWYRQFVEETVIYGNTWTAMPGNFDITQNGGLYTYQDGWFVTTYTGLVKISGNCVNEKGRTIVMRLFRQSSGFDVWHSLSEYNDTGVISFNAAFMADNVQIRFWANNFTILKCNLLFEAVE